GGTDHGPGAGIALVALDRLPCALLGGLDVGQGSSPKLFGVMKRPEIMIDRLAGVKVNREGGSPGPILARGPGPGPRGEGGRCSLPQGRADRFRRCGTKVEGTRPASRARRGPWAGRAPSHFVPAWPTVEPHPGSRPPVPACVRRRGRYP